MGVDFGGLKPIKEWLEDLFDHTLLINEDDPKLVCFLEMEKRGICLLQIMPKVGVEDSAKFIFEFVDQWVRKVTSNLVSLYSVECRENEKIGPIHQKKILRSNSINYLMNSNGD